MGRASDKISALEEVAKKWSDSEINWAVANGLEDYPDGIGRDLDVLIEKGKLKQAVQLVIDVLVPMNWTVLPNLQGWIWWVVAFREREDGTIDSLQIDLFEHLQWAFTWVVAEVGSDGPLVNRGPFLEDPGAAVAKRFILNGLSSGVRTFEKKPWYLKFTDTEIAALPKVLTRISGRDWPDLRQAAVEGNLQSLDKELRALRKTAYRHAVFSSGKFARLASAIQKQWVVNLAPVQGAPVVEVGDSNQSRAEELVRLLVCELEALIFHRVEVISDSSVGYSTRELRRLSCLQVVLVFCNVPVPAGLKADFVVSHEGDCKLSTPPTGAEGDEVLQLQQVTTIRSSLLALFETKSTGLFQKHHFSSPKI